MVPLQERDDSQVSIDCNPGIPEFHNTLLCLRNDRRCVRVHLYVLFNGHGAIPFSIMVWRRLVVLLLIPMDGGYKASEKKTATNTTPYLITIIFIFLQLGHRIVSDRRGVLSLPGTLEKNGEIFHTSHFPYLYGFFNDKLILSNLQIRMVFSAFNCSGKLTKLLLHCTNVNTHLRTLGGWSKSQKDPVAFAQPSDAYGRVHSVTMATPRNRSSNGTYEPTAVSRLPLFFVAFTQSFSLVNLCTLVHSPSTVICHFCDELQCIGICSPYIGARQFASLEIALQ